MRKTILMTASLFAISAVVVSSHRPVAKECDTGQSSFYRLVDHHEDFTPVSQLAMLKIDPVPEVRGFVVRHEASIPHVSKGYTPEILAMVRGPTTNSLTLLPFIRDKDRA
jgi:hypothetical protein